MDIISNATTNIMLGLAIAVGVMSLYMVFLWLRKPIIARLGLRNIPRRPGQSLLIVLGLTLSTIIIVSSLSVGDTLNNSIRSQAIEAYGEIDEVLSPPILSTLTQFGLPTSDPDDFDDFDENAQETPAILQGGVTTLLTLLQNGLPGISEERYVELRSQIDNEPLIDAAAPSIIFPTIIRDVSSGQGEPFGFIFAVDEEYEAQFGLRTVDGEVTQMADLRPGVGNIFEMAANLFSLVNQTTSDVAAQLGFEDIGISEVAIGAAALGTIITNLDADTLQNLNLEDLDLSNLNLEELDLNNLNLESLGLENLNLESLGIDPTTAENTNLNVLADSVFSAINLNTLGQEVDRVLGQVGLELRHGEVYLNELGAQQLNARVGDALEIYIGPIPLPYRVKGIVEEAGPMAALAPVVVMQLSEAQRLLFMEGRVNNILISNQGNMMEGIQHTEEVNNRLRVLSLSDEGVENMAALLRRPDVLSALDAGIAEEEADNPLEDAPEIIASVVESVIPIGRLADDLKSLRAELDKPGISDELRQQLANRTVQFWLLQLDGLPADVEANGADAIAQLTELDLIEPLSKQTVVVAAEVGGAVFTSVFSLFGVFSILAGVLLIFMIFVMLAAERRSEMGMARAIGMQRNHLVQMFVTEGVIYDLVAAALGVVLGLAISYVMIGYIGSIINTITRSFNDSIQGTILDFRFEIVPTSIIIAYCIGVLLTFIVVTYSSWRVSRLNIVAAIRNLPESSFTRRSSWLKRIARFLVGPILAGLGIYIIYGTGTLEITRTQLGASLAVAGFAFLLGWLLEWTPLRGENRNRLVYSIIGVGLLVLWVAPWSTLLGGQGALFEQNPATVLLSFALSGPLIILGGILTVIYNADVLLWILNWLLGGIGTLAPVLRTAIAYPLNARFRTGMAMLLFAMIITTVTIMAVVIETTQTIVTPAEERSAGFEIQVDSTLLSFFNPINDLQAEIDRHPDFPKEDVAAVARISSLRLDVPNIEMDGERTRLGIGSDRPSVRIAGLNDGYMEQAQNIYTFQMRAPGYESDEAIWQALRERSDVAIITENRIDDGDDNVFDDDGERDDERRRRFRRFLLTGITLPDSEADVAPLPEVYVELHNSEGVEERSHTVQIIGVLAQDETLAGGSFQVNEQVIAQLTGEAIVPDNIYVKVSEGADVRSVAQEIERAFLSGGLNTTIMAEAFAAGQAITRSILQLFQGFMALGLLVGIAALGVISSRTVVERRQQIGMLRAIGYQPYMVALSFVLEASFIALVGIGIGTATGVILGQNIIGELYSAITDGASFATPWGQIGLILLIAYLFSILTTILPAYRASKIYPAEALRYD